MLRTTHKTCMDYYAQKIRKKLTDEQIAQRSKDMPFETPKELCDIFTPALHVADGGGAALRCR